MRQRWVAEVGSSLVFGLFSSASTAGRCSRVAGDVGRCLQDGKASAASGSRMKSKSGQTEWTHKKEVEQRDGRPAFARALASRHGKQRGKGGGWLFAWDKGGIKEVEKKRRGGERKAIFVTQSENEKQKEMRVGRDGRRGSDVMGGIRGEGGGKFWGREEGERCEARVKLRASPR